MTRHISPDKLNENLRTNSYVPKTDLQRNVDKKKIEIILNLLKPHNLGYEFTRIGGSKDGSYILPNTLEEIKYCFSASKNIVDEEKEKIYSGVNNVKSELISFLYAKSNDKGKLNQSIGLIQSFIMEHRDALGRSLSLRVYRLMRDVIMGIENSISIKVHRTPQSIRAYCELFIYIFPFYYAPTLIKNVDSGSGEIINSLPVPMIDNDYAFIVYGLNIIISFILISLFNVQEQIENPYDQDGMDDIKLKNYELDY